MRLEKLCFWCPGLKRYSGLGEDEVRRMARVCSNCQHCFYKNDDYIMCQITSKSVPQEEMCDDWEEDVLIQCLRKARGETE